MTQELITILSDKNNELKKVFLVSTDQMMVQELIAELDILIQTITRSPVNTPQEDADSSDDDKSGACRGNLSDRSSKQVIPGRRKQHLESNGTLSEEDEMDADAGKGKTTEKRLDIQHNDRSLKQKVAWRKPNTGLSEEDDEEAGNGKLGNEMATGKRTDRSVKQMVTESRKLDSSTSENDDEDAGDGKGKVAGDDGKEKTTGKRLDIQHHDRSLKQKVAWRMLNRGLSEEDDKDASDGKLGNRKVTGKRTDRSVKQMVTESRKLDLSTSEDDDEDAGDGKGKVAGDIVDQTSIKKRKSESEICPICLETLDKCSRLMLEKCKHVVCRDCWKSMEQHGLVCPVCRTAYGILRGNQPDNSKMTHTTSQKMNLPGYPKVGTITITYNLPDGIQTVKSSFIQIITITNCMVIL